MPDPERHGRGTAGKLDAAIRRLGDETYRIARGKQERYSDPAFSRVLLLFRAFEKGIPPGPGAMTDQNPDLLRAFTEIESALNIARAENEEDAARNRYRRTARRR